MRNYLRRSIYGLGAFTTLALAFHLVENARGSRAWQAWQQEREAAGESFEMAAYAPPPVPDADNFALAPRVSEAIMGIHPLVTLPAQWPDQPIGNWREGRRADLAASFKGFPAGELERTLAANQEALDALTAAARRPSCRLPLNYSANREMELPALLGFRGAGRLLQVRALEALRTGRQDAAFQDVITLLRMGQHFEKEPILLCQLLRMALGGIALQPIWEGLATHAWTERQLVELDGELAKADALRSISLGWKAERVFTGALPAQLARKAPWSLGSFPPSHFQGPKAPGHLKALWIRVSTPRGWLLQNAVRGQRVLEETLSQSVDPANHRIDPRRQDAAMEAHAHSGHTPYTFLCEKIGPALGAQNVRAARMQVGYDQARTAIALERHRRAKGAYPKQLADLGLPLPHDVIDGQPLRYRLTAPDSYVLYSLGWNGVDDGGRFGQGKDPLLDGDWAWLVNGGPAK